jgi:16S rRNA processing protein RimM
LKKCNFVSVGKIVKPQGKRGEVRVLLHSTEGGSSLKQGRKVRLEFEGEIVEDEVEGVRKLSGKERVLVVKLKGVGNRTQAFQLTGYQIKIKEEEFEPLEEDTFYFYQISGCLVWDKENNLIGKVENIISAGENEVLVVKEGKKEYLIPFVKSICVKVDLKKKKIIIDPPDGLLNLNEI